ncbi:MAG TPA: type II toxin-antitoxin system RelE/ParE family toxin [Thermoanaerobaculia bacterium]
MAYKVEYAPDAVHHLGGLTARERATVLAAAETQLTYEPAVETRNRKPMRANPLAPWQLRVGAFRVYYDVVEKPERTVVIHAVGLKERNRVRIGGEEIEL